jgi:rhamnogalacturonan endolyase
MAVFLCNSVADLRAVYKNELEVATTSVIVSAGTTVTANIADKSSVDVGLFSLTEYPRLKELLVKSTSYIWQIGDFDGTPAGFRNAE